MCVRRRVAGRPKKGGRKRFVTEWREPKVMTIYVVDDEGNRDKSISCVTDGTLGNADEAFELLLYHLRRLGAHRAKELVFLGDGAKWIWSRTGALRDELGLPAERFTEIVDYFHVIERLAELVGSRKGWSQAERSVWLEKRKKELMSGDVESAEKAAVSIARASQSKEETEAAYWSRNRERLRYGSHRKAGRPIGSGAVESAVRRVVNLRMKGASIAWTEEHAEGILHLRAHAKSGRWREIESNVLHETGWRPRARRVRTTAEQAAA